MLQQSRQSDKGYEHAIKASKAAEKRRKEQAAEEDKDQQRAAVVADLWQQRAAAAAEVLAKRVQAAGDSRVSSCWRRCCCRLRLPGVCSLPELSVAPKQLAGWLPCLPVGCVQEAQLDALVDSLRMSGADMKQGLQRMARDKECSEQEVSGRWEWLG